jgi:hypothetical protein
MAITDETLKQLAGVRYGPISFGAGDGSLKASLADRTADVAVDGPTIRIWARVAVPWPEEGTSEDVDRRVGAALAIVGGVRPDLVTLAGERESSSVVTTLWLDAGTSGLHDLATAVRTCILLGEVAWLAVDQVAMDVITERRILREAADAQARLEAAEQAFARLGPLPESAGPAPVVATPPPPSAPPPPPPSSPVFAAPEGRHCTACGAANAAGSRFCIACGTAL